MHDDDWFYFLFQIIIKIFEFRSEGEVSRRPHSESAVSALPTFCHVYHFHNAVIKVLYTKCLHYT